MVLPRARALLDHATPRPTPTPRRPANFNHLGVHLAGQGELGTAVGYLTRACDSYQRPRGSEHPHTLNSRNNLAYAYD
jgi:hypothetical protein